MARKITLRSLTLLAFLLFAAQGWTQNNADSCYYTVVLTDYNYTSFSAGRVLVCRPDGTVIDTIGMPANQSYYYVYNLAVSGDSLLFRYLQLEDIGYNAYNYYISINDAEDNNLYSTYGYYAAHYEEWYATPYFFQIYATCPTCYAVSNISVPYIDSTKAQVTWSPTQASQYIVQYGDGESYQSVTTTDTAIWINNLVPLQYYDVIVTAICGANDTSSERYGYFQAGPQRMSRIYVMQNAPYTDSTDGSSWGRAFSTIYDAYYIAEQQFNNYGYSTEIWIAEGSYYDEVHAISAIHYYGGFEGNEPPDFNLANRDFDNNPTILVSSGNYYVVSGNPSDDAASSIDGFTIQGCQNGYGIAVNGNVTVSNCIVRNNGIGIYYDGSGDDKHVGISNCKVTGSGAAAVEARNVIIDNTLIYDNPSFGVYSTGNVTLRHSDIVDNYGDNQSAYYNYGTYGNDTIVNCIIWNNNFNYKIPTQPNNEMIVTMYTASDDTITGTGNVLLSHDNYGNESGVFYPNFLSPADGDYRLNLGSACIDAAPPISGFSTTDLGGNARTFGSAPDMGCYESDGTFTCVTPSGFGTTDVTATSVTVNWSATAATSYTMQWRLAGSDEWTTVASLGSCQYLFSNLTENTLYEVRVKGICTGGLESDYSDVYSFRTACNNPIESISLYNDNYWSTSSYMPIRTYYPMSMSYMMVGSEELGGLPRTIDTIAFRYYSSSQYTRHISVAMAHSDISELTWDDIYNGYMQFESTFEGDVTFSQGWNYIVLNQPFSYDGLSNLVIGVFDSTGVGESSSSFYVNNYGYRTLYSYGYDMEDVMWYNTYTNSYRPDLYIGGSCDMNPCPTPRIDSVTVTDSLISIAASRLGVSSQMEYSPYYDDNWMVVPSSNTIATSQLASDAEYKVRLRTICASGDTSHYIYARFHTVPFHYEHVYVKADAAGNNDGTSWDNAFTDINAAIDAAANSGNYYGDRPDVRVAAGIYYGDTNSDNAFNMVTNVNVFGGFAGNEPNDFDLSQRDFSANTTILDGQGYRRVLNQNYYLYEPDSVVWDGFTIQNGFSNYSNGGGVSLRQGGILRNCRVTACVGYYGGGIYSQNGKIQNCTVDSCSSTYSGNGIYDYNGRVENTTITGCTPRYSYYSNNGALYASNDTIVNCSVTGDSSYSYGGGYYYYAQVVNCLFADNAATYYSSMYAVNSNFVNCDIVNNRVRYSNEHSAFNGNSSTLTNCIVWGNYFVEDNTATEQLSYADFTISHCAIEGNSDTTNGNVVTDAPSFVSADEGDYRLLTDSPCIDAGTAANLLSLAVTDLGGNSRNYGDAIDLGCYENNGEAICPRPAAINVTVGGSAAIVSWRAGSVAEFTELEYRQAGDVEWTSISGLTNGSYMLEGLTYETNYEVRLRNSCGSDFYSAYTSPLIFRTDCASRNDNVFIGDTMSYYTISYLPYRSNSNNSYSQQIFLSSELGYSNVFSGIRLHYNSWQSLQRHLKVYLGHTSQSTFGYNVEGSAFTLLFDDTITFHNGWNELPFIQSFAYNGTDNVVLAVIDQTEEYDGNYFYFTSTYSDACRSVYTYGSETPYELDASTYMYTTYYRNNVMFVGSCENGVCPKPLVTVTDITDSSAIVNCQTSLGIGYQLQYKSSDADVYTTLTAQGNRVVLADLVQNKEYVVRMRTICAVGDTSQWNYVTFTTPVKQQTVFYVATVSSGRADGSSWNNATSDLNYALSTARAAGQTYHTRTAVWIAQGTYYGNFTIMPGVNVYGGFEGNEQPDYNLALRDFTAHPTILDAQHNGSVLSAGNDYINEPDSAAWDGFTLQNGNAVYDYYNNSYYGGGAYLTDHTTLRNSVVRNCYGYYGGGVYASGGTIENCRIEGDSADYGGGVYMDGGSKMINCLVANNTASNGYAGFYAYSCYIYSSTIVNNYVNNNGTYANYDNYTYIYNSIIWGNKSNNSATNQLYSGSRTYYSGIEGGLQTSSNPGNWLLASDNIGNVFSPNFVQPSSGIGNNFSGGNWRLNQNSPCANRGSNSYAYSNRDFEGNNRIINDTIDMGCYESQYFSKTMPVYDSIVYVKNTPTGNGYGTSWDNATDDIEFAQQMAASFNIRKVWVAAGTYFGDTASNNAFNMHARVNVYGGFAGNEPPDYDLSQRDFANNATILDGDYARRVLYQSGNFSKADSIEWNGFTIRNGYATTNNEYGDGGGAYLKYYSKLVNCIITNNQSYIGGGVYLSGSKYGYYYNNEYIYNYTTALVNCRITGNRTTYYAAGVYNGYSLVSNCLIDNNTASSYAGGVYNSNNAYIINSTIVKNSIGNNNEGGGVYDSYGTIRNSIIWGNKSGLYPCNYNGYGGHVYSSAIEDADSLIILANSNDGVDPTLFYVRFNDPENGDFTLHPTSACLDLGDTVDARYVPAVDLAGNDRHNGNIDLGCYEASDVSNCPSVIAVSASNITNSSATITWTPEGSETSWTVRCRQQGSNNDTTFVATTTTVNLTGLELNRTYSVYIRSLCPDNSMSAWSIPATFTTLCDTAQLAPLSAFTNMMPANDETVYSDKVDFGWSSIPEATSYDLYLWADGQNPPTTPIRTGLTMPGASNVTLSDFENMRGSTYHWYVKAWNECISRNSDTVDINVPYLPNLHVSGFTMTTPVANQTVTVEWTVVNDGEGPTPPGQTWNDYIWLSGHSGVGGGFLYNVDEQLLATVPNLQQLGPGESYTNSVQVQLPLDYQGNFFFFVFADQYSANNIDLTPTGENQIPIPYTPSITGTPYPYLQSQTTSYPGNFIYSQIKETIESDNFFYDVKTILPPPSPDLLVTTINHPLNANSGDTIQIRWQITNQGEAATTASIWNDAVYISANETFSFANATLLGTTQHNGNLSIGGYYIDSITAVLPLNFSGAYYVYVKADVDNAVYENIFEENNVSRSSQTLNVVMSAPPDFAVDSIGALPAVLSAKENVTVSYRVTNVGARAVTDGAWYDAVYLSTDSVFNPGVDRRLVMRQIHRSLAIGDSYVESFTFTVPDSINATRYLFFRTDVSDDVFEYTFEDNNIMCSQPVTLATPDLAAAIVNVPETVNSSEPVTVTWTVKNVGQGNLSSRMLHDRILFNGQPIYTASQTVTIAAGDSIVKSAVVRLDCSAATTGSLTVATDYLAMIYESSESNNISEAVTIALQSPDLALSNLTVADEGDLWSGTAATVSWTLANNGSVAIDDTVTDIFYFAPGTTLADSSLITTYRRRVSLAPGASISETLTLTLPNGVYGTLRMHQVANGDNYVCEGANSASNHVYTAPLTVNLSPYADLIIADLMTASSYNIGETFLLDYSITNHGTGNLTSQAVTTKFYISQQSTLNSNAKELGNDPQQLTIAVGDTVAASALLRIPSTLSNGHYYIFAVVDANNSVYEYTGESNNTKRSEHVLLNIYPLDITASALAGNNSVEWGGSYTYTLTVSNNSQVVSLASSWIDQLFISTDNTLQTTDQRIGEIYHRDDLEAGDSYNVSFNVTIPFGMPATSYLIAVADANFNNPDVNINNNMFVLPISVSSVPTADLAISDMTILDANVFSGQPARIAYTVTNVSDIAIDNATWTDKLFLSANNSYENTDVEIGSVTKRNFSLAAGASYTDTATFRVPLPQNGTMFIIARANSGNNFYESNTANNTMAAQVSVALPLPGDLVVTDIVTDENVISGRYLHLQWKVRNIGENTLSGSGLRSLAYLSTDNNFDANDRLLGNVAVNNVMLVPGGELSQQMATRISGLPEGNYYVIVKTDVSNAFNEINDTNNTSVSLLPFTLSVRNLAFNTPLADTLKNNQLNDYKLTVGDNTNETVRIHVDAENTTSGAVNMIYVSHNTIGSDLNYSYSTIGQFTHSPEIYIPSTEAGYYGINVVGTIPNDTMQAVNVQADILPFELRSVEPSVGGNTGNVTLELTGSRFRPDMKVWIQPAQNPTEAAQSPAPQIYCDTLYYDSYYKAYATFNLQGADTGYYKVGVLNFCEGEAVLDSALKVVEGTPEELATNLIMPSSPRPNRTVVLLLEFGNIGTTDIEAPIVELECIGGSYISLTNEGLSENKTKIQIPLQTAGGVRHTLRPGATGSINVYCYTAGPMVFSIKRVK